MAVGPSAWPGVQLVPAPHSSVAVRNRQCRDDAGKGTVELMEGARGCAAQRGSRGKRSVCAAKGPCSRARGATVRTRGGQRTEGQLLMRREVWAVRKRARPIARASRGAPACDEFPMEIIAV